MQPLSLIRYDPAYLGESISVCRYYRDIAMLRARIVKGNVLFDSKLWNIIISIRGCSRVFSRMLTIDDMPHHPKMGGHSCG